MAAFVTILVILYFFVRFLVDVVGVSINDKKKITEKKLIAASGGNGLTSEKSTSAPSISKQNNNILTTVEKQISSDPFSQNGEEKNQLLSFNNEIVHNSISYEKAPLPSIILDSSPDVFDAVQKLKKWKEKYLLEEFTVKKRNIPTLIHFTREENIPSIVKYGLRSVDHLTEKGKNFLYNDPKRLDGHKNALSLSIGHPNDKLFYRWRQEQTKQKWVVLEIEPCILWSLTGLFTTIQEISCGLEEIKSGKISSLIRFCAANAADARSRGGELAGVGEHFFHLMFKERKDIPSRESQMLNTYDPTDVQAEILYAGIIRPGFISGAVFSDGRTMERWADIMERRPRMTRMCSDTPKKRILRVQPEGTGYFGRRQAARNTKWNSI